MFGLACLTSCFDDETTNGTGNISEITIDEGAIKEVYDIDRNQTLTVSPVVKQTYQDKPLAFTWEIGGKVFSTERDLVYVGDKLGVYQCRLIVENEDGKAFYPFKINVNSPYEEGMTVLSYDEQGKSMLSFMLKQREEGMEDHFETGDCFAVNNPDEEFAPNVSDMVQCDGSLIISCQGDGNMPGTIYYLNEKTFVVENKLEAPEYPDFKPVSLGIPANGAVGAAYPILCENGKVYEFSTTEGALAPASKLQAEYANPCGVYSGGSAAKYTLLFWDKGVNGLCMLYNGYGPYYCSNKYHLQREECTGPDNYFDGREFVTMFLPRVPEGSEETPTAVVVTKKGAMYQKVVLNVNLWIWSEELGNTQLDDNGGMKTAAIGNVNLTAESPFVASRLYYALFYGVGNKVYRWNYTTSQMLNQAGVHAEVGTANAVVTGMELDASQKELFVAFYEPNEPGLNGHVWVYNTDTGELLRKYDNVCYRPVKIMYKKK